MVQELAVKPKRPFLGMALFAVTGMLLLAGFVFLRLGRDSVAPDVNGFRHDLGPVAAGFYGLLSLLSYFGAWAVTAFGLLVWRFAKRPFPDEPPREVGRWPVYSLRIAFVPPAIVALRWLAAALTPVAAVSLVLLASGLAFARWRRKGF
jgi:hypothetical protein